MARSIGDLFATLAEILPPWAVVALAVVVAAAVLPGWLYSIRVKQIRGRLRKAAGVADPDERLAFVEEAAKLTGFRGRRLVAMGEEALKMGVIEGWKRAVDELEDRGLRLEDAARLRAMREAARTGPRHPVEIQVRAEALLDQGLYVHARREVDAGLAENPGDDDLLALRELIDAAEASAIHDPGTDEEAKPTEVRVDDG